jgi:hypothetical protein
MSKRKKTKKVRIYSQQFARADGDLDVEPKITPKNDDLEEDQDEDTPLVEDDEPEVPEIPVTPVTVKKQTVNWKKLLLWAGIAFAVYYLFLRKSSGKGVSQATSVTINK